MKPRSFDALKLDVEAFGSAAGHLDGQWPLASLARLTALVPSEAVDAADAPVVWSLEGERRPVRASLPETWLHVVAGTSVALQCQRCLQPVMVPLDVDSSFRFVADEATAEELDADSEEDILVMTRHLDARELVEDELLLALPIVALHEECPEPLPVPPEVSELDEEEADVRPNPFAGLAALKRGSSN